jgi:hypothetical protein
VRERNRTKAITAPTRSQKTTLHLFAAIATKMRKPTTVAAIAHRAPADVWPSRKRCCASDRSCPSSGTNSHATP